MSAHSFHNIGKERFSVNKDEGILDLWQFRTLMGEGIEEELEFKKPCTDLHFCTRTGEWVQILSYYTIPEEYEK